MRLGGTPRSCKEGPWWGLGWSARDGGAESPGGGAQHAPGLRKPASVMAPMAVPSCWGCLQGRGAPPLPLGCLARPLL